MQCLLGTTCVSAVRYEPRTLKAPCFVKRECCSHHAVCPCFYLFQRPISLNLVSCSQHKKAKSAIAVWLFMHSSSVSVSSALQVLLCNSSCQRRYRTIRRQCSWEVGASWHNNNRQWRPCRRLQTLSALCGRVHCETIKSYRVSCSRFIPASVTFTVETTRTKSGAIPENGLVKYAKQWDVGQFPASLWMKGNQDLRQINVSNEK